MSDKNDLDWEDHVEGQLVDVEGEIEDAIRACEHQELRSELVSLYRRIIGIQYRYYDDTPGVDTDLTDDDDEYVGTEPGDHNDVNSSADDLMGDDDDDDLLDIDDVEFIDDLPSVGDPDNKTECECDCESSESFGDYNASDVMDADDLNERIHNIVEDSKDD